ncbi:PREDICTED: uncharacterized protein LOC109231466 [Nicotiana attenuata]|uniref:uncharacterized protein LOC109231466 n=1 Tax=Nicotiana attenuata TaxID=49451 RepID=UPI0009050674|nr:PREDICTED: uncharacterized protein LOC109231466 [Nicotiana attenuata]
MTGNGEERRKAVADTTANLLRTINEVENEDMTPNTSHGSLDPTSSATPSRPIGQMGYRTQQARHNLSATNDDKVTSARRLRRQLQRKNNAQVEMEAAHTRTELHDLWILYTDGLSNALGSGLGLVLEVPTGKVIRQSIRCPDMTNNEAEYEAVIAGLKLELEYGARWAVLRCDSQLVVNQVTRTFQIKEQRLQKYQVEICKLLPQFDECQPDQIPRAQNVEQTTSPSCPRPLETYPRKGT